METRILKWEVKWQTVSHFGISFLLNMNIKKEQVENSLNMFQKPLSMSSGTAGGFIVN